MSLRKQHNNFDLLHKCPKGGRGSNVFYGDLLSAASNRNNNNLFDLGLVNAMVFLYSLCPCVHTIKG